VLSDLPLAPPFPTVMIILLPSGATNSTVIGTPLFAAALESRSMSDCVYFARDMLGAHVRAFFVIIVAGMFGAVLSIT
jgi:hypothetical protein